MLNRIKHFFVLCIPILLPLLGGLLFLSLTPSYDSPQARSALLQEKAPGVEVLAEEAFEKYTVCQLLGEEGIGYGVFQKTLGKWKFDHIVFQNARSVTGDFYMGDQLYFVVVTSLTDAVQMEIRFVNSLSGKDAGNRLLPMDGRTMIIFPAQADTDSIAEIIFRDRDGNLIE